MFGVCQGPGAAGPLLQGLEAQVWREETQREGEDVQLEALLETHSLLHEPAKPKAIPHSRGKQQSRGMREDTSYTLKPKP